MFVTKKYALLALLLAVQGALFAQIRLDVEGDAKIFGRISTTTANNSVLIGDKAGQNLGDNETLVNDNVFLGVSAGENALEGKDNVYLGRSAGLNNNGVENVFIGRSAGALIANSSSSHNVFIGHTAGINAEGDRNIIIGTDAGSNASNVGSLNTFIGANAGKGNTGGGFNTFLGGNVGVENNNGLGNTFAGYFSGRSNTFGSNNAFFGRSAGLSNQEGNDNTFIGKSAGGVNINGSFLTAVGSGAQPANNLVNATAIGSQALVQADHRVVLGNVATTDIQGFSNWGTLSDQRFKTNVQEDVKGLDFILQLRPVTYQLDARKLDNFLRTPFGKSQTTDTLQWYQSALRKKSNMTYTGFLAQEVVAAAKNLDYNFSGVVPPANANDHYSLRYAEFVVPLVKAVQEQQAEIEEVRMLNDELRQDNAELKARLTKIEALLQQQPTTTNQQLKTDPRQQAWLSQNRPNPFSGETTIEYRLPGSFQSAEIRVLALDGRFVRSFPVFQEEGTVTLYLSNLPASSYTYSLIADGQVLASKQLVAH